MSLADEAFDRLVEEFFWEYVKRHPEVATSLGIHEYDGELPSGTVKAVEEDRELLLRFRDELSSMDRGELTGYRRYDYPVALRAVDLFEFYYRDYPLWRMYPEAPDTLGDALMPLMMRGYPPLEDRVRSLVSRLEKAPRFIEESRERLDSPVRVFVEVGLEMSRGLAQAVEVVRALADQVGVPGADRAVDRAEEALLDYASWLEELLSEARSEFWTGRENFEKLLKLKGIPFSANEVLRLGEEYLARYKARLREVARSLGFEDPLEALKALREEHPRSRDELLALYSRMLEEARRFVAETGFAPLPPGERVRLVETPVFLKPVTPFAAYVPPGRFDPVQEGLFLVTVPDSEEAYKEHNPYSVNNTVVHEAYPGHHLQHAWANRHPSLVRLLSCAAELVEGWAHYCEEAVREEGFYNDPKHMLVVLVDAVWRAVRVIVDVRLHSGEMSFEEAVEMLVRETGMGREQAVAEVKRYTYTPTYQLSYLLGKHMIRRLEEEVKEILGDRYSRSWLHEAILEEGCLPLAELREVVLEKARALASARIGGP